MAEMNDIDIIPYLQGVPDACFSLHDTPAGRMLIAGDDMCLKAVMFSGKSWGRKLVEKYSRKDKPETVRRAEAFLDSYFINPGDVDLFEITLIHDGIMKDPRRAVEGKRKRLVLDLNPFTMKEFYVYRKLMETGPGQAVSYGVLSQKAGIPRGGRFAGNVMAKNIFPIIIPCHRVIKGDGGIGRYSGGKGIKELLLRHEGYFDKN